MLGPTQTVLNIPASVKKSPLTNKTKKQCFCKWEEINWMTCIMTELCRSLRRRSDCWFKKKNLWKNSRLLSSVAHSCNIKTLIKSPINMLVPFCFTPADDGKEALFPFFPPVFVFFNPPSFSSCGFRGDILHILIWYGLSGDNDYNEWDGWLDVWPSILSCWLPGMMSLYCSSILSFKLKKLVVLVIFSRTDRREVLYRHWCSPENWLSLGPPWSRHLWL